MWQCRRIYILRICIKIKTIPITIAHCHNRVCPYTPFGLHICTTTLSPGSNCHCVGTIFVVVQKESWVNTIIGKRISTWLKNTQSSYLLNSLYELWSLYMTLHNLSVNWDRFIILPVPMSFCRRTEGLLVCDVLEMVTSTVAFSTGSFPLDTCEYMINLLESSSISMKVYEMHNYQL